MLTRRAQADIELFWVLNDALQASPRVVEAASSILNHLSSYKSTVVALHVRAEEDWLLHCIQWENIADGIIRDNCLTNSEALVQTLQLAGMAPGSTLYLAGGYLLEDLSKNRFLAPLTAVFNVATKGNMIEGLTAEKLAADREIFAAIDFEVCAKADVFVGNSVSSFAALLLLMRERNRQLRGVDLRHFHYNSGNIPLQEFAPLDGTPICYRQPAHGRFCPQYPTKLI
jgi:hypothetical protein